MTRGVTAAIRPDDLPALARALAERHRTHRAAQPLLDERWTDPAAVEPVLAELLGRAGASGAMVRDGDGVGDEVMAFVLGAPRPSPVWGPNVWIEVGGHAARDPEALREAYAEAAPHWVVEGWTAHYAVVPAHDPAIIDAWFRLGFGQQQVHAVRPTPDPGTLAPVPEGVRLRRAERSDVRDLAELELLLPAHQALAPTFSAGEVPSLDETVAEWEEDIDSEQYASWVVDLDGRIMGSVVACSLSVSREHVGLAAPPGAGYLGVVVVRPEARGRGLGRVLGEQAFRWAAEQGYTCVVTDWRATNLQSSRAWTGLGFVPTFLRLHRHLGY